MTIKGRIAIPCNGGHVWHLTMQALLDSVIEGMVTKIAALEIVCYPYGSPIARVRNGIVSDFLATDFDVLFWVDSDVSWEPGALIRLLRHEEDMVAGVYPKRQDKLQFPVRWLREGDAPYIKKGELIEVEGVPFGFTKTTRKVLELMTKDVKWFKQPKAAGGKAPLVFEDAIHDGLWYGEDIEFCRRYRALGGKVYVDPEVNFGHFGQKTFKGQLAATIEHSEHFFEQVKKTLADQKRNPGVVAPATVEYVR